MYLERLKNVKHKNVNPKKTLSVKLEVRNRL